MEYTSEITDVLDTFLSILKKDPFPSVIEEISEAIKLKDQIRALSEDDRDRPKTIFTDCGVRIE